MAAHYGIAVLPARPRRPRDKANVEACVLIVKRWLVGRPRDRRFYSLAELNAAIGELLKRLNEERPIRRLGVTRRQLLEELDRPALKPLPAEPYDRRVPEAVSSRSTPCRTVHLRHHEAAPPLATMRLVPDRHTNGHAPDR
jgi:hypothetical protein